MTGVEPVRLAIGDQVWFAGDAHVVRQLNGRTVSLADPTGLVIEVKAAALLASPGFHFLARSAAKAPLPARGILEGLSPEAVAKAEWWQRHVEEVLHGTAPDAAAGTDPRPDYDPQRVSLRQRELAKVSELVDAGTPIRLNSFQRMRQAYERQGLLGLVDGRSNPKRSSRIDPRVVEAVRRRSARRPTGPRAPWAGCGGGWSRSSPNATDRPGRGDAAAGDVLPAGRAGCSAGSTRSARRRPAGRWRSARTARSAP